MAECFLNGILIGTFGTIALIYGIVAFLVIRLNRLLPPPEAE